VSLCRPCPALSYKDTIGPANCTLCFPDSFSEPASIDVTMCLCNKGYTSVPGQPCDACVGGYFKASRGFEECTQCKAGTYSSTVAAVSEATCIDCPMGKTSLPASTFLSDCVCPEGDTLLMPFNVCVPCAAGTFKEDIGNHNCSLCEAGKFSGARGVNSSARCLSCLPGATTRNPGATGAINCTCDKGYTGRALGINCTACLAKEYKATYGSAACTPCRDFSQSLPASRSAEDCECLFGYLEINSSCTFQCPKGFHADETGEACEICPLATFQPEFSARNASFCLSCGPGTYSEPGSGSFDDCFCAGGYTGYPTHPRAGCSDFCNNTNALMSIVLNHSRYGCEPCPQNFYKEGTEAQICSACPRHSTSHAATPFEIPQFGDDGCMCDPGFTGGLNVTCCFRHASYSSENVSRCVTVTLPGAPWHLGSSRSFPDWNGEALDCVLQRHNQADAWERLWDVSHADARAARNVSGYNVSGYNASNSSWFFDRSSVLFASESHELVCVRCAPGSYKPSNGSAPCLLCPNTTYANQIGALPLSTCLHCPRNSTSDQGSTLLTHCQCLPGFFGRNGTNCTACPPQTYKPDRGEGQCLPCPANSFSPHAASWCHCNVGFQGPDAFLSLSDVAGVSTVDNFSSFEHDALGAVLWAPFWDFVLAATDNGGGLSTQQTAEFLDFRNRISEKTNFDPSRRIHWSEGSVRSRFRLVGGTWTAVTQDLSCVLCEPGKLKPWEGPGRCERCSERVLPWSRAAWVSPTMPSKACAWECDSGSRHVDVARNSWDISALWWSWGLSLGLGHQSNNLPNICVPCTTAPAANPCGKGEYWSTACSSTQDAGCTRCSVPPAHSSQFTDLFPLGVPPPLSPTAAAEYWRQQDDCARVCDVGYFDSRYKFGYESGFFDFSPTCEACPVSSEPTFRGNCPQAEATRQPCGVGGAAVDGERVKFTGLLQVQVLIDAFAGLLLER